MKLTEPEFLIAIIINIFWETILGHHVKISLRLYIFCIIQDDPLRSKFFVNCVCKKKITTIPRSWVVK